MDRAVEALARPPPRADDACDRELLTEDRQAHLHRELVIRDVAVGPAQKAVVPLERGDEALRLLRRQGVLAGVRLGHVGDVLGAARGDSVAPGDAGPDPVRPLGPDPAPCQVTGLAEGPGLDGRAVSVLGVVVGPDEDVDPAEVVEAVEVVLGVVGRGPPVHARANPRRHPVGEEKPPLERVVNPRRQEGGLGALGAVVRRAAAGQDRGARAPGGAEQADRRGDRREQHET